MLETRTATAADAAIIASHRRAMFAAMGGYNDSSLEQVQKSSEPWTARMISDGKYLGWIIFDNQKPVASAGLMILDWPPHPFDPSGEARAYILNVFVERSHRRRGLARELLRLCLLEARRRNLRVVSLHASSEGRPLYESLGFRSTNEMLLTEPG